MLDTFEIVTTSGVVLWSRTYTPTSPAIINGLIKNVFIEERTRAGGAGASDDISAANNPPLQARPTHFKVDDSEGAKFDFCGE